MQVYCIWAVVYCKNRALTCNIQDPLAAKVYPACMIWRCRVKLLSKFFMHCERVLIAGCINISVTKFSEANCIRRSPKTRMISSGRSGNFYELQNYSVLPKDVLSAIFKRKAYLFELSILYSGVIVQIVALCPKVLEQNWDKIQE